MFRMSAKIVLCNCVTLDMSGSFLLVMLLYLWPMLLLVVSWITVTHYSRVSLSAIFVNYRTSTIVQLKSYHIPVDTLEQLLYLRNYIGFLLNFFHTGFPKYLAPYISSYSNCYSTRHSQSGCYFLVVPNLQLSVHKSVKQFSYSFAFDAPLFGMLFLIRFVCPPH